MIFDDHDVHDDWNTSEAWRRRDRRSRGGGERIVGALSLLGLPAPREPLPRRTGRRPALPGVLRPAAATRTPSRSCATWPAGRRGARGVRWSFRRDSGAPGCHDRLPRAAGCSTSSGAAWSTTTSSPGSGCDAALGGEGVRAPGHRDVAALAAPARRPRPRGVERDARRAARGAAPGPAREKLRQAADLEHWAAFGDSFERLGTALTSRGPRRARAGPRDRAGALRRRPPRLRRRAGRTRRPDRPGHQLTSRPCTTRPRTRSGSASGSAGAAGGAVHPAPGAAGQTEPSGCTGTSRPARSSATRSGAALSGPEARFPLSVTELGGARPAPGARHAPGGG